MSHQQPVWTQRYIVQPLGEFPLMKHRPSSACLDPAIHTVHQVGTHYSPFHQEHGLCLSHSRFQRPQTYLGIFTSLWKWLPTFEALSQEERNLKGLGFWSMHKHLQDFGVIKTGSESQVCKTSCTHGLCLSTNNVSIVGPHLHRVCFPSSSLHGFTHGELVSKYINWCKLHRTSYLA